jgi:hypothetical protein
VVFLCWGIAFILVLLSDAFILILLHFILPVRCSGYFMSFRLTVHSYLHLCPLAIICWYDVLPCCCWLCDVVMLRHYLEVWPALVILSIHYAVWRYLYFPGDGSTVFIS